MSANPQEIESGPRSTISVDQVLSNIGVGRFHTRLWYVCGLGFAAGAIEVVVTAFLLPELRKEWKVSEYELGMVPAASGFGSLIGMIFWGSLADQYGRKTVFLVTSLLVGIFGALSALADSIMTLVCLRALVGFGYGGSIAVDFTLFTEFLPTEQRTDKLFQMQAFWPVGQIFACILARFAIPSIGWRGFLFVCALPSVATSFMRPWIPESPRWLLLHGRTEEAFETCRTIADVSGKPFKDVGLRDNVQLTIENTTSAIQPRSSNQNAAASPSALGLFSTPLLWTSLGLLIFGTALHATAYGTITFMPTLLQMKGIPRFELYDMMIWSSLAQLPGVLGAVIVARSTGRLLMMKSSLLFVAMSFLCLASAQGTSALLMCMCFASFFTETAWALYHTYIQEVFPTKLRATASGLMPAMASVLSAATPFCSAYVFQYYKVIGSCFFFATCCAVGSVAAILFLHIETSGRDLQDSVSRG